MLMRDTEIKEAVESGHVEIDPFGEARLQGASYDLSIGGECLVSNSDQKILLLPNSKDSLHLQAGDFALVLTKERVKVPLNITGVIGMRSSLARKGLILLAGMQIDPGFNGHLRFGLYNASPRRITLDYDDELCMVEFHKLAGNVERAQPPIPELVEGKLPEADKYFLRSLETTSLSDLAQNVQSLSQNVSMLTTQMRWVLLPGIIAILVGVVVAVIVGLVK